MTKKGNAGVFCLNIRKYFFTVKLAEPWHRLHKEVVTIHGDIQVLGSWPSVALLEQRV